MQQPVYKYCNAGGLDILKTRKIFLTRPRAFNDPFDLKPHYGTTLYVTVHATGRTFALPESRLESAEMVLKLKHSVVLSLSGTYDSLLMWGYYADKHKGFVIGFQGPDILASQSGNRVFRHVTYAEERPSKPVATDLTDDEVWLTKSKQWEHEDEWRVIDSLYAADGDPTDQERNHWRFDIAPGAVREVILGCRAEPQLELDVMNVLRSPDYAHVQLFRMEDDERHYRLNRHEIPRRDWPDPSTVWP